MEENAANHIDYLLAIDSTRQEYLAAIRHWGNLKVATESTTVWVKNIDFAQVNSLEVKSMPHKSVFYERAGKLFPINSNLPERTAPSLLWTPIERAIPIDLPSFNHNFFGLNDRITVEMVPSAAEQESVAMVTYLDALRQYAESAPLVRLQPLSWCILNNDKALLMGTPLLPINGDVFWKRGESLLPAGYDLNFYSLSELIDRQLCPENDSWILWNTDATYSLIGKDDLQPLSRSSIRAGIQQLHS